MVLNGKLKSFKINGVEIGGASAEPAYEEPAYEELDYEERMRAATVDAAENCYRELPDITEDELKTWWVHDSYVRCYSSSEETIWWPVYRDTYLAEQAKSGVMNR